MLLDALPFHPIWLVVMFIPAFALIWCFVNYIIYRVGWIHLQAKYHWKFPIDAPECGVISMRYRKVNYNSIIRSFADAQGFYFKPVVMFRLFNKPVFIPWSEVREINPHRIMLIRFTSVTIGLTEPQTLHITRKSFKKMESAFRANLKSQYFANLNQAS